MMTDARVPSDDDLRPATRPDLRRDPEASLQLSRIAAALFWRDGFAAARGDDIAAVAGIATRTLWRHFRSKEACIEPILTSLAVTLVDVIAAWPLDRSLEDHLLPGVGDGPVSYSDDQLHAMRMIELGRSEPALRSAWLMVCDDAERRIAPALSARLGLPPDDAEALRITAAVVAANRAYNDELTTLHLRHGIAPDACTVARTLVRGIVDASGGRLGQAVTAPSRGSR